jgi:hypothetical protein
MATTNRRSARGGIEFVFAEPSGPLDSPLGADLRRLEEKIRAGDRAGIEARWAFGRRLLAKRGDQKKLPPGLQEAIVEQHGISRSEVLHRIKFAEKYPDRETLSNILDNQRTWFDITRNALYEKRFKNTKAAKPDNVIRGVLPLRRLRRDIVTRRGHLTVAEREEIRLLVEVFTEILAGYDRKAAR